jgi:hypothetical protein
MYETASVRLGELAACPMEGVIRENRVCWSEDRLGIYAEAKNGGSCSLSYLYWGWIRHIAKEEGVVVPQSGSATDSLSEDQAKKLASVLRAKAEKIREGLAPRDATSYVQQTDKEWFPPTVEGEDVGTLRADFDNPDEMDETAKFFESSGGVTLRY